MADDLISNFSGAFLQKGFFYSLNVPVAGARGFMRVACNRRLGGVFAMDRNSILAFGFGFVFSGVRHGNQVFQCVSVLWPQRDANRHRNVQTAVAHRELLRCNLFAQPLGELCNLVGSLIRKKNQELLTAVAVGFASMCADSTEQLLKWNQNVPIDDGLGEARVERLEVVDI